MASKNWTAYTSWCSGEHGCSIHKSNSLMSIQYIIKKYSWLKQRTTHHYIVRVSNPGTFLSPKVLLPIYKLITQYFVCLAFILMTIYSLVTPTKAIITTASWFRRNLTHNLRLLKIQNVSTQKQFLRPYLRVPKVQSDWKSFSRCLSRDIIWKARRLPTSPAFDKDSHCFVISIELPNSSLLVIGRFNKGVSPLDLSQEQKQQVSLSVHTLIEEIITCGTHLIYLVAENW